MFQDPIRTLKKVRTRLTDVVDVQSGKEVAVRGAVVLGLATVLIADPVAAQSSLDSLVSLMNNLADLLQRVGLAVAVVGMSAAGIAYMAHQPRTAKSIAQNVVIGTIILLLSSAAIEFISGGL